MNFKIKHISEVFADPITSICDIGKFDGPATTYGDLVFVREGIDGIKTYMNSIVFRELLLSNPELITKTTGIVCVDINEYNDLINKYNTLLKENEELKSKVSSNKKKARLDAGGVK